MSGAQTVSQEVQTPIFLCFRVYWSIGTQHMTRRLAIQCITLIAFTVQMHLSVSKAKLAKIALQRVL